LFLSRPQLVEEFCQEFITVQRLARNCVENGLRNVKFCFGKNENDKPDEFALPEVAGFLARKESYDFLKSWLAMQFDEVNEIKGTIRATPVVTSSNFKSSSIGLSGDLPGTGTRKGTFQIWNVVVPKRRCTRESCHCDGDLKTNL